MPKPQVGPISDNSTSTISLGPVLEQADTDGFEDPDNVPITERTFRNIQDSIEKLYLDNSTPKEVRRRSLEASVRAPQTCHQDAVRNAYSSGDKEWMLTAVFSMRWVRGFDDQILLALKSDDPEIHHEAVNAAGNWELDAAWSHIVELVNDAHTHKVLTACRHRRRRQYPSRGGGGNPSRPGRLRRRRNR